LSLLRNPLAPSQRSSGGEVSILEKQQNSKPFSMPNAEVTRGLDSNSKALPDAANHGGEQGGATAEGGSVKGDVGQHVVNFATFDGGQQLLDAIAAFVEVGYAAARHGEQDGVVGIPRSFLQHSVKRAARSSNASSTICLTNISSRHIPSGPFLKPVAA